MIETKQTFCSICEAFCGLEVDVEDNRIRAIRPNPDHVVSDGYACVKGTRYDSIQHSPDRITAPQKRIGNTWQTISWEQALDEIAEKLGAIRRRGNPQAIGHFVGAPGGANLMAPIFRGALFGGLGSNRMYGTGTCGIQSLWKYGLVFLRSGWVEYN